MRFVYAVIFIVLGLTGCAALDLRPQKNQPFAQEDVIKGQMILEEAWIATGASSYWPNYDVYDIIATDQWPSSFNRKFTPIPTSEQKFRAVFDLHTNDIQMQYIDGKFAKDGLGIKGDQTYKYVNGQIVRKDFADIRRYLPYLRNYFILPQALRNFPVVAFLGTQELGGVKYEKIFAGRSDAGANSKEDQYIAWVNPRTRMIDHVEMTMRSLDASSKGFVSYADFRSVNGMMLPFQITLPVGIGKEKYFHRFIVHEAVLIKEDRS